jgi:hypothetical protein
MNLKLIATVTSILTSVLLVYFFFIIMKPNTNEKVIPTYLKNGSHHTKTKTKTKTDTESLDEYDPILDNGYDNGINRHILDNIIPLSSDSDDLLPANELKLMNYKDLENINSEKEVYTNDVPLFISNDCRNKKVVPIDLNSQHRRINFY